MKLLNITKANKWLIRVSEVLKNVLVFSIICGLLFDDPFGTIGVISTLLTNIGDRGLTGILALVIIIMVYKRPVQDVTMVYAQREEEDGTPNFGGNLPTDPIGRGK